MKNRRKRKIILAVLLCVGMLSGCSKKQETNMKEAVENKLDIMQVRSICELATMECYYHNVVRATAEGGFLVGGLYTTDKQFWIEYVGIVKVGVDMSQVQMELKNEKVTISVPKAQILSCTIDETSFNNAKYITSNGLFERKIKTEDVKEAFTQAQQEMKAQAEQNDTMFVQAKERAVALIENYVRQIGNLAGKEYEIEWVEV